MSITPIHAIAPFLLGPALRASLPRASYTRLSPWFDQVPLDQFDLLGLTSLTTFDSTSLT